MPLPPRRDQPPVFWRPLTAAARRRLPAPVRPWLCDTGSLTQRLRSACGPESFSVRLIAQHWQSASAGDAKWLGIPMRAPLIERQVQLMCGQQPLVYARSLIPLAALHGSYTELGSMGQRPLGEKLFADPVMIRGEVLWSWLPRGSHLYHTALGGCTARPPRLYGRSSLFSGAAAPVLVSEYFLPNLPPFPRMNRD